MKSKYSMTESEREVMEMLWKQPGEIKQSVLLELCAAEGKEWKRQTLNTFLSRLEEKGLVSRASRMVKAVYSEKEMNYLIMQEAIDTMYQGKLSNLVMAFAQRNGLTKEDERTLQQIIGKITD